MPSRLERIAIIEQHLQTVEWSMCQSDTKKPPVMDAETT
ncbi:hypothetical protein JCM19240_4135 [Vibrio maritimus]|uniref:Uncharacterized protein n=1 Tax=Vibrio maritimus TaxID=990268 RepID=A0A090T3Q2_9VIBR|nr:hypothetical protein JCM19240_4135 [Vibrio maritimus]